MAKKEVQETVDHIEETKRNLKEQETEKIFLHEEEFNCKTKNVNINGTLWRIPVGEWVEVPKSIAELFKNRKELMQKSKKEAAAFQDGLGKNMSGSI